MNNTRSTKYSDGGSMMIAVFASLGVWAIAALGLVYFFS